MTPEGRHILLHAVGDIGVVGRLAGEMARHPSPWPFHHVVPRLREADIVFGNLEIPCSGGARIASHESPRLEAPEGAVARIAAAGFHVLSIANNHVMDFGATGLERTRRLLEDHGIAPVGGGMDLAEARRPAILERSGLKIAFLAYSTPFSGSAAPGRPGAAPLELGLVKEDVGALRGRVDRVVVSLHFGMMYLEHPTPQDMALAEAIREAGADLVLGHHPHVLQGIDETSGGTIAYSLGEFVFDPQAGNYYARVARETRHQSLILRIEMGPAGTRCLRPIPTKTGEDLCPRPLESQEAEDALRALDDLSRALHDPDTRRRFWDYAGARLMEYEASGLWWEIRRGHLGHFLLRLPRLRPRHLKLVLGYVRSRLRGGPSATSSA